MSIAKIKELFQSDLDQNSFRATYSVEDDKLRLYIDYWMERDNYLALSEAGFKHAPKQELLYTKWTPGREDICLFLAGEIEPEETTLIERAEERAARFDSYCNNRQNDANVFASAARRIGERFSMGQPILIGHHSEASARRDQKRIESAMNKSVQATRTAEYWIYRANGVENHANRKTNTRTIKNRIKSLFADMREQQRIINHAKICILLWSKIEEIQDDDILASKFNQLAGAYLATGYACPYNFSREEHAEFTERELANKIKNHFEKIANGINRGRVISHILNRLGYEQSTLGKVEKFENDLTPVILQKFLRDHGAHKPKVTKISDSFKAVSTVDFPYHISDSNEIIFTSDEWRDLMQNSGYDVPVVKKRKLTASAKAPLLNPSQEEAIKLQALWNSKQQENSGNLTKIAEHKEIESSFYSARSGGDYSPYQTYELDENGLQIYSHWDGGVYRKSGEAVCRVRTFTGGGEYYKANSVVHLVDKPCKPLPVSFRLVLEKEEV